jgi:hypothetical protein
MNKQYLSKCPYCDYLMSLNKEEQKRHLKNKHRSIIVELAKKNKNDIEWAAGEDAAFFYKRCS